RCRVRYGDAHRSIVWRCDHPYDFRRNCAGIPAAMRFRALERKAVSHFKPEVTTADPQLKLSFDDDAGFGTIVSVLTAISTGLDRAHEQLEWPGKIWRQQLLVDPEAHKGHAATIF